MEIVSVDREWTSQNPASLGDPTGGELEMTLYLALGLLSLFLLSAMKGER